MNIINDVLVDKLFKDKPKRTKEIPLLEEKSVNGDKIVITDGYQGMPIQGLNLYGKSVQATTTGAQLFDKEKRVSGKVIDSTNGNVAVNDRYACSDFIEIPQGTKNLYQTNGAINQRAFYDENKSFIGKPNNNNNTVVPENAKYIRISSTIDMQDMSDIMLNVGETAKPYEPYTGGKPSPSIEYPQAVENAGDSGQIKAELYGKNLIPFPYHDFGNETVVQKNGVTYTLQADGAIKAKGTPTDQFGPTLSFKRFSSEPLNGLPNGTNTDGRIVICRSPIYFNPSNNATFILFDDKDVGKQIDTVIYPQIEVGTMPTAYEQYKTLQELTIQTPNGLSGIPVNSDGNYTDENGQQWICDEIDLTRGKYIQRICKVVLDGSEEWMVGGLMENGGDRYFYTKPEKKAKDTNYATVLCDQYSTGEIANNNPNPEIAACVSWARIRIRNNSFSTVEELKTQLSKQPVMVFYQLHDPVETDLPPEIIEAYKKLHTNYPTTTVLNDAGVWMEMRYLSPAIIPTKEYALRMWFKENPII